MSLKQLLDELNNNFSSNPDKIKEFINNGDGDGIVNCRNTGGETPLMLVCEDANFELVKFLVEKGADINAVDKRGRTVIEYASNAKLSGLYNGLPNEKLNEIKKSLGLEKIKIIEYLCNLGVYINQNILDKCLELAADKGRENIVVLLISKGAKNSITESYGKMWFTVLDDVINFNSPELVKLIASVSTKEQIMNSLNRNRFKNYKSILEQALQSLC